MKMIKCLLNIMCPNFLKSLMKQFKLKKNNSNYKKGIKKANELNNDKIKVVFISQYIEAWNSFDSVYKAFKQNDKFEVLILSIPMSDLNSEMNYSINKKHENKSFDFLKSVGIKSINAYKNNQWFDLKKYGPNYVFYNKTYNNQYPDEYKSENVCSFSKICVIPYGFNLFSDTIFDIVYNYEFMLDTYLTFATDVVTLKDIQKKFSWQYITRRNKYKLLGFPRFDLLKDVKKQNENSKITIAWMPRWEFNKKGTQKTSHFLDYNTNFINYVKKTPNINFIFRPHPLMFQTVVSEGYMTSQQVNNITEEMKSIPNLFIDYDSNYMKTLLSADILIADATSLLAEFFVTGKPIIYCDNDEGFNKIGKMLYKTFYKANSWNEIEQNLIEIINTNDFKQKDRKKILNKLTTKNIGNIGNDFSEYIIKDFMLRRRKDEEK